ncbi:MAG TPA: helix-turn-helix transcriptional regulator [Solirubrobacterales bacterium]|nr:helix-turn-helix transcriptional regulator [Solirubrobacterales bacterium]
MTRHRHDAETIRHLKALGQAFAEARKGAGLTQVDLHDRSGVERRYIARVETGKIDPGYEVMQTMAAGIGLPLGPILDRASELAGKEDR